MISKRSNILAGTVVIALLFTAVIPRSVFGIKNFSLVREAQAQEGEGIMQNIMPILLLMMLMNMMQQKGNQLQREQADAAKNANSNLLQAGNQSSNGGNQPGLTPPSTNPLSNQPTNPLANPITNPLGVFLPR